MSNVEYGFTFHYHVNSVVTIKRSMGWFVRFDAFLEFRQKFTTTIENVMWWRIDSEFIALVRNRQESFSSTAKHSPSSFPMALTFYKLENAFIDIINIISKRFLSMDIQYMHLSRSQDKILNRQYHDATFQLFASDIRRNWMDAGKKMRRKKSSRN